MRRPFLLVLAAFVATSAGAARRVTVMQLAEALAADTAQHRSDEDVARQVGTLELTERLTPPTLDRLAARLPLQPRTALALQLLSDQSTFLAPPADELPATAPPDATTQQQMLDGARAFAVQTWGRLPNFFVSRITNRFDDSAQVLHKGEWPVRAGLHPVGTSNRRITFRDGKDVLDEPREKGGGSTKTPPELGLSSWGEFGPALTVVLADAAERVTFSHWEQTAGGLASVFAYEVPREASHYAVAYSYMSETVIGRTQYGYGGQRRTAQQVANIPKSRELQSHTETPAYHGTIAIDPATGAVLRLTVEAELGTGEPLLRAATMIEYGPVTIGEHKFICPVRSLAISIEPGGMSGCGGARPMALNGVGDDTAWQNRLDKCDNKPVLLINETRFADYHRLGSTARIITDGKLADAAGPDAIGAPDVKTADQEPATSAPAAASPAAIQGAIQPPAGQEAEKALAASTPPLGTLLAHPQPETHVEPPPPPAEPVIPEISMTAANTLPDSLVTPASPSDTAFSIKVTTRLVDVGLVAYDKKGHPVTDLTTQDFEVYDNGRKQEIRFFTQPPNVAATPVAPPSSSAPAPDRIFSNRAANAVSTASPAATPEAGATILLIDGSHIAWADMNNVRGQMLKFLGTLAPTERVGLYSMTGLGFRVLVEATSDHSAVMARLKAFMPTAQSVANAQDEEMRNRQQFEEVHNVADLNSVNGNRTEVPDAEQPVDPQLLTMGSNPARASLVILAQVARHLSSIAGHKSLVWFSSDNVFADWQDLQVAIDKSPKDFQAYAVRVQEAMNDAHTAIYPFDVSQLEGGAIGADIYNQNVMLAPTAAANSEPGGNVYGRNTAPGRVTAQMSQDLHPIQGPIREVAAATGGRPIRRSGDLAAALSGIVEDGHATYQLSFTPQGPADDQYHAITVKLNGRRGLTLRYRTGYLFQKEPATLKDRFQQAVWRPLDVNEIAVTADIAPVGDGASVKVNIAAGDLEMQQQAGRWMDKLDIFFIQRDDTGLHAHVEGQTLGLRLKPSTYQNLLPKGVPFEHAVELRPGMGSLRVLVVDENSGRMGSITIPSLAMRANP